MDPYQNRNQAFGEGITPPSFMQQAARINSTSLRGFRPTGSLNGMSTGQYQSTLGGLLPVSNGISATQSEETMGGRFRPPNGMSSDTYSVKRYFGGENE